MFSVAVIVLSLQVLLIQGEIASSGDGAVKLRSPVTSCDCPPGRDGLPGRDGRDGIVGPQGPSGFSGFHGHKGEKGGLGNTGLLGQSGAKGERGDFSRGSQGLQGSPGPTGPQGNRGAKGERGEANPGPPGMPGLQGTPGARGPSESPTAVVGGVTYNRWGNSNCCTGVERVYAGRIGSTHYSNSGGAANYLCMPNDPQYTLPYRPGVQGYSYVYGTEYELPVVSGRHDHNAPCAVCYLPTKHTVIMIPAKTSCPSGWTREYYGYIMSTYLHHGGRTMYECVDRSMESVHGSRNNTNGGRFYNVEANCNGMACPPYNSEKELNCVVCSK